MLRTIAVGAALAFSMATVSNAAIMPVPVTSPSDLTIKVRKAADRDGGVVRVAGAIRWRGATLPARLPYRARRAPLLAELRDPTEAEKRPDMGPAVCFSGRVLLFRQRGKQRA